MAAGGNRFSRLWPADDLRSNKGHLALAGEKKVFKKSVFGKNAQIGLKGRLHSLEGC